MYAVVQCLKFVPELRDSLEEYKEDFSFRTLASSQSITASLREVFDRMNGGNTVTPVLLLQTLHHAFLQFAQPDENGSYQQQDANECWSELLLFDQFLSICFCTFFSFVIFLPSTYVSDSKPNDF